MKRGKFMVSFLLVIVMLAMTACGGNTASSSKSSEDETYKISYVVSVRDEYLNKLEEAVRAVAVSRGVDMDILFAGEDSAKVLECIEVARESGSQAVLINMVNAEDTAACIEAAGDMKVVFINRVPSDYSVLTDNSAVVASDEHLSGKYEGEFLADYFNKAGKKEIKYILLKGTPGLVATDLRSSEALAALEAAGITATEAAVVDANYDRQTAQAAMKTIIDEKTAYDCIISNNDAMAIGAIEALREAGIDPAAIPIVGVDATDDALTEIREGALAMSVHQSAEMQADGSIMAAINLIKGSKSLVEGTKYSIASDSDRVIYVPFEPVTPDNLSDFLK